MSNWYIRQDGGSIGPFSTEAIARMVDNRKLKPIDFVYEAEANTWHLVANCSQFLTQTPIHEPSHPAPWIALAMQGAKRRVLGPLPTAAVTQYLAEGRLAYSDFVWHPDRPQWVRIGNVDELDRRQSESQSVFAATDSPDDLADMAAQIPTELLYANIQRTQNKAFAANVDVVPPDACGDDLADPTRTLHNELLSKFKLFSFFILASALFSASEGKAESIETAILRAASTEPTLLVQTDAPIGSRIEIHLDQALGDVPGVSFLAHDFTIVREAGELPTVSLEDLDLAPGTYRVHATVNRRETRQSFFRGTRDANFENALAAFRKEMSFFQQKQKKALFYGAKKLRALTQDFTKQIKTSGGKLTVAWLSHWTTDVQRIENQIVSSLDQRSSAYPERHEEIFDAIKELRMKSANFASETPNRSVASASDAKPVGNVEELQKLADRFGSIHRQTARSLAPHD